MIVRGNSLVTAPVSEGLLESITRDTFLQLGEDLDLTLQVRPIERTEIYTADEAFLCNSFEEVRPIRELDGVEIGTSAPGTTTRRLWDRYEAGARGLIANYRGWLDAL